GPPEGYAGRRCRTGTPSRPPRAAVALTHRAPGVPPAAGSARQAGQPRVSAQLPALATAFQEVNHEDRRHRRHPPDRLEDPRQSAPRRPRGPPGLPQPRRPPHHPPEPPTTHTPPRSQRPTPPTHPPARPDR